MKVRKVALVAHRLSDRQWHTSTELARIQNRFGASIHLLRTAEFDGKCWRIVKRRAGVGVVEYRFEGFDKSYTPKSLVCPKCGTRLHIRDDRKTDGPPSWTTWMTS